MIADVTWVVLHGGSHNEGAVSFEAVLGSLATALVVVGVLWYLGVFHELAGEGGGGLAGEPAEPDPDPDADPESGAGD